MDFNQTVNYRIADLAVIHRTFIEKHLSPIGIHSGQVFILFELWQQDGLSQIELAKNLKLSPPTINKIVRGLKETGFVELKRSESDARLVNVFLTLEGFRIKKQVENIWQNLESEIAVNLTDTEKLIFLQLLDKILLYFYNDSLK